MKRTVIATALAGLAAAAVTAAPAHAGGGLEQSGDGGYKISVSVTITSDSGAVVQSGGTSLAVAPTCWWELYNPDIGGNDATTPEGFQKFYDESIPLLSGHAAAGRLSMPDADEVKRVTEAAKNGTKYRWYSLRCQEGHNGVDEGYTKSGGNYYGTEIGIGYAAFIQGQEPEPYVAPEDLATSLWDFAQQGLTDPAIDRNPKVSANGGATLVNVPTWFWVTNPATALADDGKLHLTATAGNTTVTLDAQSNGVAFTSPAGSTSCSVNQAKYAYGAGASEGSACTISFDRSSAGWPVTASTTWGGTWSGNDGTGAALPEVYHSTTVNVPVVEVQVPNR
ncbi:hypothetical protein E0H73_08010 [Kribbella pittospori]|uniref:Uncharacterized protein n=1 Tax=Kribbella pittospori TaxID=722689 RepID=A0A4R0KTN6_9ACTN|nr:hypothetical protein [Kribbella pittospori]TCC64343.1 hypothetical protein E0H73_08010 [Kribbella pittospori]